MIHLTLFSSDSTHGSAEMHIDYQEESIGITFIQDGKQFDFNLELHEWQFLKKFIDMQVEEEKQLEK